MYVCMLCSSSPLRSSWPFWSMLLESVIDEANLVGSSLHILIKRIWVKIHMHTAKLSLANFSAILRGLLSCVFPGETATLRMFREALHWLILLTGFNADPLCVWISVGRTIVSFLDCDSWFLLPAGKFVNNWGLNSWYLFHIPPDNAFRGHNTELDRVRLSKTLSGTIVSF